MLVSKVPVGWRIVFQRTHALLAFKLADHLRDDLRPEPWHDLLAAIVDHDDGQAAWDSDKLVGENGEPKDFRELGFQEDQARQVVYNSRYKSRWQSLLTSLHTTNIYSDMPEAKAFLKEQKKYQETLFEAMNVDKTYASRVYRVMKWCDELSLILCREQTLPRKKELIAPLDGIGHIFIEKIPEGDLLTPWPFREQEVELEFEYHVLENKSFGSSEDFANAIRTTHPEQCRVMLRNAGN